MKTFVFVHFFFHQTHHYHPKQKNLKYYKNIIVKQFTRNASESASYAVVSESSASI